MNTEKIKIDGEFVEMRSTGTAPIRFKQVFGENPFTFMNESHDGIEITEFVGKIAYIMKKSAEGNEGISYENYLEWLDSLSASAIALASDEILDLWLGSQKTQSHEKKSRKTDREMTVGLYTLRCLQVGLHIADLEELTVGEVYDIMIEAGNDNCEYTPLADQSDIDAFIGR